MCDVNHRSLRKMVDKIFQLEENRFLNGAGGGGGGGRANEAEPI